jgi:hypothetical protein
MTLEYRFYAEKVESGRKVTMIEITLSMEKIPLSTEKVYCSTTARTNPQYRLWVTKPLFSPENFLKGFLTTFRIAQLRAPELNPPAAVVFDPIIDDGPVLGMLCSVYSILLVVSKEVYDNVWEKVTRFGLRNKTKMVCCAIIGDHEKEVMFSHARTRFDLLVVYHPEPKHIPWTRVLHEYFWSTPVLMLFPDALSLTIMAGNPKILCSISRDEAFNAHTLKKPVFIHMPVHSMEVTLQGVETWAHEKIVEQSLSICTAVHSSQDCAASTVDFVLKKLKALRESGVNYHIIAFVNNTDERMIETLFREHSLFEKMSLSIGGQDFALKPKFPETVCDVLIHDARVLQDEFHECGISGIDDRLLNICCFFELPEKYSTFVEIVSQVLRPVTSGVEEKAYVIAHPGLGVDRYWEMLKQEKPEKLWRNKFVYCKGSKLQVGVNVLDWDMEKEDEL